MTRQEATIALNALGWRLAYWREETEDEPAKYQAAREALLTHGATVATVTSTTSPERMIEKVERREADLARLSPASASGLRFP